MKTSLTLVLLLCSAAFAQIPAGIQTQLFADPNAGTAAGQGTYPFAINSKGTVAGLYIDATGGAHGFTRTQAGEFTTINGFNKQTGITTIMSINSNGQVAGIYTPPSVKLNVQTTGFVYNGSAFLPVSVPPVIGFQVSTQPLAINDAGVVTGIWSDQDGSGYHSFVRSAAGQITTFDAVPNDSSTVALSINTSGSVVGYYYRPDDSVIHGFVRDAQGNITPIDPEGSTATYAYAINASGQIAGYYLDSENAIFGFLRKVDGSFVSFTIPGATVTSFLGSTNQIALSDAGAIAGTVTLSSLAQMGWVRSISGKVNEFQVCGQTSITSMNAAGHLTGFCGNSGQMLNYDGFTF